MGKRKVSFNDLILRRKFLIIESDKDCQENEKDWIVKSMERRVYTGSAS